MRLPTNYNEIQLTDITAEDLNVIEIHGKVLEFDETMDVMMIELSEVCDYDQEVMRRVHKRGRLLGVKQAGDKLFTSMSSRSGNVAAMDYLRQMSGTFAAEVVTSDNGGFSFNVVIDE